MITGNADGIILTEEINTLTRLRPIANDISHAPDKVDSSSGFNIAQNRLERCQVAVDVGDYGVTHVYDRYYISLRFVLLE